MKPTSVCIVFAIVLCTAAVADATLYAYAKTCSQCKSVGAKNCGYAVFSMKGVSCGGQTKIKSCADCNKRSGRCVWYKMECYL
ncbi:uncharacterized protein LOC131210919 [Anopheles bellator]|uniref:uncharacterized protein LOC131210919 n=1 Tax=Anopheles bellator TaxID=139047 RepID=UPI0026498B8F|nr:uncharacterized protein LOC131210919 [Anopheles bellator]